jgi:hypothetical protein
MLWHGAAALLQLLESLPVVATYRLPEARTNGVGVFDRLDDIANAKQAAHSTMQIDFLSWAVTGGVVIVLLRLEKTSSHTLIYQTGALIYGP